MTTSRLLLLLFGLLVVASVATGALLFSDAPRQDTSDRGPGVTDGRDHSGAASNGVEATPSDPAEERATDASSGPGSSDATPLAAVPPSGTFGPEVPDTGRTATLAGAITVEGLPASATLTFTAGPNAGEAITTATDGAYTWPELYPGYAIVRVDAGFSVTREVLLRHRKTVAHSLALGDHGVIEGRVTDEDDSPVGGARVTLDGIEGATDADGVFRFTRQAPGEAFLVVHAEGLVPYCERVRDGLGVPGGKHLDVTLQRGATLEVSLSDGPAGEVLVWLLPGSGQRLSGMPPRAAYPWHELNPLVMGPGQVRLISDLPYAKIEAAAFGAASVGREFAWLTDSPGLSDVTPGLRVELKPLDLVTVRVLRVGEAVPGATVMLRHGNRMAATLQAFGKLGEQHMNRQPLAILPAAEQVCATGPDGRAVLGIDRDVSKTPWVTVLSPGGQMSITRALRTVTDPEGSTEMVIDLAEPEGG